MPLCQCDRIVCRALWQMRNVPRTAPDRRKRYRKILSELEAKEPPPEHLPDVKTKVEFEADDGEILDGVVVERSNNRTKYNGWFARVAGEHPEGGVVSRWFHHTAFHSVPVRFVSARTGDPAGLRDR